MKVDEKSAITLQFILIVLILFVSWQMQYDFAAIILRYKAGNSRLLVSEMKGLIFTVICIY